MQENTQEYQVLARKYRPAKLSGVIGQDAMVRTLTNAIGENRIPHAFILTGIRGVGKTSTARIIAKSLICTGRDGENQSPTTEPCGECDNCKSIAEDRHVDILEMDAASRTGVGDIREIIESVNYAPVMARYKVYIIDEVHMLSKSAFNALLKTLEEPPPHAKFIFATTEIRKIPVTILSRCMRFDLPRVDVDILSGHFADVAEKEGAKLSEEALRLIAAAAEGSVRDGLSLLDQAIGSNMGDDEIAGDSVREMLGIADRAKIFDLFDAVVTGKSADCLTQLREIYRIGADPIVILQDLLEISHFITQLKVIPDLKATAHVAQAERDRAAELAGKLGLPYLARMWQMLLKGISEAQIASNSLMAAEMILIRLCHVSDQPPPGDLLKNIKAGQGAAATSAPSANTPPTPAPVTATLQSIPDPCSFDELVELFNRQNEYFISSWLQEVSLVNFDAGKRKFEFHPSEMTPGDLAGKVSEALQRWTGNRWMVAISSAKGEKPLREVQKERFEQQKKLALEDERVKAILDLFPEATITKVEQVETETSADSRAEDIVLSN